ncbi:Bifunctional protein GlmU [Paenibacillus allorhizoplanae]|uniref:Bifunctional protein GlmU n=1 Tax=Paenibacillus allorhizoplanae TaxID=2905648 RepID=A0ABM9CBW4_9BACL|nr:acyltransferase [Paenibacillus allorhizoplanae]CAH1207759.1 Bifunctional protein GlmU [Paenibacillus allorhizoplanae]
MSLLKKVMNTLIAECRGRGVYHTFLMYASHLMGILRAFVNTLLYWNNMKASIFALQSNSRIEAYSKHAKIHIGKFVFIRKHTSIRVDHHGELHIGEKVFINDSCHINCANRITIGRLSKIAPNVSINDHDHNYRHLGGEHLMKGEVIIGENVWIGSNVVILRDTYIGDNAVIAAGSVVKGRVPANTVFLNKREKSYIPYAN